MFLALVTGKDQDFSEFDKRQFVMARRHQTDISETAKLFGCSRATVVGINKKCINDSETSSSRQKFDNPHFTKDSGYRRLPCLIKRNWDSLGAPRNKKSHKEMNTKKSNQSGKI
ncbi:hypothetical protein AVEN_1146-1 [Araneus ventricosus]|uniref:Uncharacterized protein n=1 Tax=Araneus ventricosus TaxID=182803 RepID=A0A4Y2JC96_ARAVE|nr:hypothetical protein AVEN_1146-1 [Araneus ventricosus]